MRRVDSGSVRSPRAVELTTSAKRMVTVLRTSAAPDRAGEDRSLPQVSQKRAPSRFSVPQLGQRIMAASVRGRKGAALSSGGTNPQLMEGPKNCSERGLVARLVPRVRGPCEQSAGGAPPHHNH